MRIQRLPSKRFILDPDGKKLETPTFIAAISSVKTNREPREYFDFVAETQYPAVLISSYDILSYKNPGQFKKKISELHKTGTFIVIDSGNYESFWHRDEEWSIDKFHDAIKGLDADLFFSFDVYWTDKDLKKYCADVAEKTAMTMSFQSAGENAAIIHGTPDNLDKIAVEVCNQIGPQIIVVAERDLGASLFERAETVRKIRNALEKTKKDVVLHLLGTGNPRSIILYSLCGADTFDGLEWCKTVADDKAGLLYHFTHGDLIEFDHNIETKGKSAPYEWKVMTHNLLFLNTFMKEIRTHIESSQQEKLIKRYFPPHTHKKILSIISG